MTTTKTIEMSFSVQFTADYFVLVTRVNLPVSQSEYEDDYDSVADRAIQEAETLIADEYGFSPTKFANDISAERVID